LPDLPPAIIEAIQNESRGAGPEQWILVEVAEAYIHWLEARPRFFKSGTRRFTGGQIMPSHKGGDYFKTKGMISGLGE